MKALAIIVSMMAVSVMVMGQSATNENAVTNRPLNKLPANLVCTNSMVPTDKQIQEAITNGRVCQVRGEHIWEPIPSNSYVYRLDGNYLERRKCKLCGVTQKSQKVWEEE